MDRTIPSSGSEEIALYTRTYYSLLRSSREVKLKTLIEAHTRTRSALHIHADSAEPDMSAFIYGLLRMPDCLVSGVKLVVMGQSQRAFIEHGYPDVETWQRVATPARRRPYFYDGKSTLAVYIASRSDIDDIVPTLTAFQIERRKLRRRFRHDHVITLLEMRRKTGLSDNDLTALEDLTGVSADDLDRLQTIWQADTVDKLLSLARTKVSLSIRLLSGSLADYRRATRSWWEHAEQAVPEIAFADRPIYFVSSNTHSVANVLSGFALTHEDALVNYIRTEGGAALEQEYADILARNVRSSMENFLYYVLKKYESAHPDVRTQRLAHEERIGIYRVASRHVFDSEIQIIDLSRMRLNAIDPRLRLSDFDRLADSSALIINIDFPLGMAAYQVLAEISHNIATILGVYIMGKAATLNGRIGDVMLPSVIFDEHSQNTYLFHNCVSAETVSDNLVYGNVLDNQKAITVLGTFLQNRDHMSVFYHEGYSDMEMEAGPYLSCVYEMIRPKRHPENEIIDLHGAPFPIGIVHYASDTPLSKGKNLGAQNLSYFGMDASYASTIAVLHNILREEIRLQLARHKRYDTLYSG
ncbi:MAG: hypothetical protein M9918_13925 [Anaerolineae bacterium]|nr:hypothetical protein [Anaerolineae bacterium]